MGSKMEVSVLLKRGEALGGWGYGRQFRDVGLFFKASFLL